MSLAGPLAVLLLLAATPGPATEAPPDRGRLVEGLRCQSDPSQTYTLYLPRTWAPDRKWPAMLILDPRGRSVLAAELFREAAEEYGWVLLSSNDTRSDGPMEPNVRAMQALWPEVHRRYATDSQRIYLAGFSGGGMLAWEVGRRTGGVAGVIAAGGRWLEDHFEQPLSFPCFGAVGTIDFNYGPMKAVHDRLREWRTPERLEVFDGPHSWMPPTLAREAVEWMEVQAMKKGLRPHDMGLASRLLDRDRARAAELEEGDRPLDALRLYNAAAATFDGLLPVEELRKDAARVAALPATRRALEEERRWDGYEDATLRRHEEAYRELLAAEPPLLVAPFRSAFGLGELLRKADAEGYEGVVARRLLESLATQTGFYLTRELLRRGDHARAVVALTLATEAAPERAVYWYNLACAHARTGAREEALEALEAALARGFTNRALMASDPDLGSLKGHPHFEALLSSPPQGGEAP